MENNDNNFLRMPTSNEQEFVRRSESTHYGREIKAIRTLLITEGIAALAVILGTFLPLGLGPVRRIILLVLDIVLLYITITSLNITRRQRRKINEVAYKVQDVTVTDTHNDFHGLRSDMIVTFESSDGKTYTMNTNTTGDMVFTKDAEGLLVIIDDEKNVLLTNKYRFYVTHS